jgi:hypothetical protein
MSAMFQTRDRIKGDIILEMPSGGLVVELEGTVQNGVIVVVGGESLPNGMKVRILVESPATTSGESTLRERLLRLAGTVDDLPPDMARNHDHYIHGTPKR